MSIKFDPRKELRGERDGKKIHFRGADLSDVRSPDELEAGQVIGVLETELAGDETTLPPGTHNLFLSNVDGKWRVHAESGGRITGEAARVTIAEHTPLSRAALRPQFSPDGWCLLDICLFEWGGFCLLRIQLLCW
jgi:hypothetical protein